MKHKITLLCCFTAFAAGINIIPASFTGSSGISVVHAADKMEKTYTSDGAYHEIWNLRDTGTVDADFSENGEYSCSWSGVEECFFSSGRRLADKKKYDEYETLSLSYDVEFESAGDSDVCVSGTTVNSFSEKVNPATNYFIVEAWTGQRPLADQEPVGSVISDGKTYDIYRETKFVAPSLITVTYDQYWSIVRTNPAEDSTKNEISGTITLTNHFKAWEEAGFELGYIEETGLNIESADSDGKAVVKKNVLSVINPGSADEVVPGDIDNNGVVNASDIVELMKYLIGDNTFTAGQMKSADMNNDGKISVIDLIRLKNILM